MNDALRMQISAYVDGELPENESQLLLRRLSQDAELRQLASEYLELGRYIRREPEVPDTGLLRGRIAKALGEEAPIAAVSVPPANNRLVKPLAGFAVAATVAMLGIFLLQHNGVPVADDDAAVADNDLRPSSEHRLDELFLRHQENSSIGTGSGILMNVERVDFTEAGLVKVEPRAELIAPLEVTTEVDEDDSENDRESDTVDESARAPAE